MGASHSNLFRWLSRLLGRQAAFIESLQHEQRLDAGRRRDITRFLIDLSRLQTALWNSLAERPRPRVLAAARQIDQLMEHWRKVASQLDIPAPAASRPPDPPSTDLDSAA